jgi:hypothetical protein
MIAPWKRNQYLYSICYGFLVSSVTWLRLPVLFLFPFTNLQQLISPVCIIHNPSPFYWAPYICKHSLQKLKTLHHEKIKCSRHIWNLNKIICALLLYKEVTIFSEIWYVKNQYMNLHLFCPVHNSTVKKLHNFSLSINLTSKLSNEHVFQVLIFIIYQCMTDWLI